MAVLFKGVVSNGYHLLKVAGVVLVFGYNFLGQPMQLDVSHVNQSEHVRLPNLLCGMWHVLGMTSCATKCNISILLQSPQRA